VGFLTAQPIKVRGGTKMDNSNYTSIIWLTQGKYTIVDNDDYEFLNQFKWYYSTSGTGYAIGLVNNKRTPMHRLLMNEPDGKHIDHANGNGLDNSKKNLRICTAAQNQHNKRMLKNNKSGYKGVYKCNTRNRWVAQFRGENILKRKHCRTLEQAAKCYDDWAEEFAGEFAKTNKSLGLLRAALQHNEAL